MYEKDNSNVVRALHNTHFRTPTKEIKRVTANPTISGVKKINVKKMRR